VTLEQALAYLESLKPQQIILGLDRVEKVLERLGHPERAYPTLHVAGTNGKGSVCAMTSAALQAAGLRTGLYTSPHLVRFEERIAIDGVEISGEDLASGVEQLLEAAGDVPLTYFEFGTVLAFLHFRRHHVGVAVLETGLGGRLDATNVVLPVATAITSIGLDHMEILGNTVTDIAREKAGILKPGVPCAVAAPSAEVAAVLEARAREVGCELFVEGRDFSLNQGRYRGPSWQLDDVQVGLRGPHQLHNAAVALGLLELASRRVFIGPAAAAEGLRQVRWPGRLETFTVNGIEVVLDGAHNPQGAQALAAALLALWPDRRIHLVFGALAEKDVAGMIGPVFPMAASATLAAPHNPRARAPEELAASAPRLCPQVSVAASVTAALEHALRRAKPGELVVVYGSLYVVGEARAVLTASQGSVVQLPLV
jgi:dihydrofolate synthase/folylpolyglutamate synthase